MEELTGVGLPRETGWFRGSRKLLQVAGGALVGLLFAIYPVFTAVAALGLGLTALLLSSFPLVVQLILIARPSLDKFIDVGLPLGSIQLNVPGVVGMLVIGAGLFHLVDARLRGEPVDRGGPPTAAFALIIGLAALGSINGAHNLGADYLWIGLKETIRLASLLVLYLVLIRILSKGTKEGHLIRAFYLSAVVPMARTTWQFLYYVSEGFYAGDPEAVPHGRLFGTFHHPNSLGLYLAVLILVSLTILRSRRQVGMPRWLVLAFLIYAGFLLVFTFSRGSWVFLAITFGLQMIMNPRKMIAPVLAVFLLGAIAFGPRVVARFGDIRTGFSLAQIAEKRAIANSFEWRLYNWMVLIGVGMDKPIFGHGTATTPGVNPNLAQETHGPGRGFAAHSQVISYFVEQGVIGVVVLIAHFWISLRWLRRRYQQARGERSATTDLVGLTLAIMTGFFITSLIGQDPLDHTATYYWVVVLLALVRADEIRPRPDRLNAGRSPNDDRPAEGSLAR